MVFLQDKTLSVKVLLLWVVRMMCLDALLGLGYSVKEYGDSNLANQCISTKNGMDYSYDSKTGESYYIGKKGKTYSVSTIVFTFFINRILVPLKK